MDFLTVDSFAWMAGVLYGLGYLTINQVALRYLVLSGTVLYILYYFYAGDVPLWPAIWTSLALMAANIIGLIQIYFRRSQAAIPAAHKDIYPLFSTLPPGDFRDIVAIADRRVLEDDIVVTNEGEQVEQLHYILSGGVSVMKMKQRFEMPPKHFVGEVAYLTNRSSSATTKIKKGSEILSWDIAALKAKSQKNARFKLAMEAVISNDLATKVTYAVAPKGYTPGSLGET